MFCEVQPLKMPNTNFLCANFKVTGNISEALKGLVKKQQTKKLNFGFGVP